MHGMAWLSLLIPISYMKDEEERPERVDWLQPMRRAMLAENGVGTVDQAMMAALPDPLWQPAHARASRQSAAHR